MRFRYSITTFYKAREKLISNDIMYMSYALIRGMTELNTTPNFNGLSGTDVFKYLNNISTEIDRKYFL